MADATSPDRRAALVAELARRRGQAVTNSAIRPRPADQAPRLSLAQRRLWLLDRVVSGVSTYNATMTMRIEGPLDAGLLRDALDCVVRRHEALRTVGVDVDGAPEGRLLDAGVEWRVESVDPSDLAARLSADASRPFDLGADVFLRATLYRLDDQVHVLIMVTHHIASDGWSRDLLFAEITEFYNARIAGRRPDLPDLPVQYGDYAKWQDDMMSTPGARRDDEFWRAELADAELVLDLPTDLPRTRALWHRGERIPMDGQPGSGDALRALARAEKATFFMAMTAAGGAFLAALSGQRDIVLGSPVANRQRPELEALIGFFVNTLIFRVRLDGNPTFRELIRRCRRTVVECLAHQDMPFDRLVELINPVRVMGRNPLFQVNFRMQGVAPPPPQLSGLRVTRMVTETGTSRFELAFGLVDQPDAVRGYLEYSSDLFRRSTVDVWQAHFLAFVQRVVDAPDAPLSPLLDEVREAVLAEQAARATASRPAGPGIRRRR